MRGVAVAVAMVVSVEVLGDWEAAEVEVAIQLEIVGTLIPVVGVVRALEALLKVFLQEVMAVQAL